MQSFCGPDAMQAHLACAGSRRWGRCLRLQVLSLSRQLLLWQSLRQPSAGLGFDRRGDGSHPPGWAVVDAGMCPLDRASLPRLQLQHTSAQHAKQATRC